MAADDKVYEFGEVSFEDANDANIPVNLWIKKTSEHLEEEGVEEAEEDDPLVDEEGVPLPALSSLQWMARAELFMPRKGHRGEHVFLAGSNSREALVAYVQKYTVPLFEKALKNLQLLGEPDEDGVSSFYYWDGEPN